jgi:predicted nucleotidyltransferase
MSLSPLFPTQLHRQAAEIARNYFSAIPAVDTILITNSCARGQALPESDLDMAILLSPGTNSSEIIEMERAWLHFANRQPVITAYKNSSLYAHLHLDIITGQYDPAPVELGGQADTFEIEIGNHISYSAPFGKEGAYFQQLKQSWLPYYNNELRLERFAMIRNACLYDLEHIPLLMNRGLCFHAFDTLYTAFHKYLQLLFISKQTYPIAYNKWIKEQIVNRLGLPGLYTALLPIISISHIESGELNQKTLVLSELVNAVKAD